jgi:hypothetical protein
VTSAVKPLLLEAASTLLNEMLLPILHAPCGLDEFPVEARLTGDRARRAWSKGGRGDGALGKVFGEFCVPGASGLAHSALCGHPFLDRAPPVITLVRLHWSPLR